MSDYHYIIYDVNTDQPVSFRFEDPKAAWKDAYKRKNKMKPIRPGIHRVWACAKIPAKATLEECRPFSKCLRESP